MRQGLLFIPIVLILMGCGGKNNNPGPSGKTTPPDPSAAFLSFPDQNAVCTTGTIISATQSSVTFMWSASGNTDSYDLDLKNLLTGVTTTQSTTQTQLAVTLLRNTPYSWYIVSKSAKSSVTTPSDVWKFYNAGPGIVTYAPFPADIIAPTFGDMVNATGGTINLTWTGNVVNTDAIANYDVYFGTTTSPSIAASAVTNNFLNNVTVASNTTYYWRVVTRDVSGNTSDSGLYQFSVN